MDHNSLIEHVEQAFGISCPGYPMSELQEALGYTINHLIVHDFNGLLTILYRLDINEKKLKQRLQHATAQPTGYEIAGLIIERMFEKMETKRSYPVKIPIDENESW